MKKKYISHKYDPFKLSSIWYDKRSALRALIPTNLEIISSVRFFFRSIKILFRLLLGTLIKNPSSLFCGVYKKWRPLEDKLVFYVPTSNNKKAVSSITNELLLHSKDFIVIDKAFDAKYFPMFRISIVSLFCVLWLTRKYRDSSDFDKKILLYNLTFFLICPGVTWFWMKVLKRCKPQCIVLANDHLSYCRSLALVCEDYGIRTIYIQHASVSEAFPELHFTYSFLDGIDSLYKYTKGKKEVYGNVILLGALRYDTLSTYRIRRKCYKRNCIGIAINDLDSNKIVNDFCNQLLDRHPNVSLRVRSHPALKNKPFVFDNKDRIIYSCATDESMIDYLDNIDIQISGDSGVHFDAIIGGVPTFVFNFSSKPFEDNYGYVKKGLIQFAESIEKAFELLGHLNEEAPSETISFYDVSYGKSYAGECSKIVAEFIINGYELSFLKDSYDMAKCELGNKFYYIIPR